MNPYDRIPYATYPRLVTHPDRLATMARLFGLKPAPVARCRVLEIGCGNGRNLIPMAVEMPASEFTGVDLAAQPVAEAKALVRAAGLRNVRVLRRNILAIRQDFGQFDYILAHGVYSWVPDPVRDALLAVCQANLAPHGVAYVSYNALPGCYIRNIVRDLLRFHLEPFQEPGRQPDEVRSFLELLQEIGPRTAGYNTLLKPDLDSALERIPHGLFHDDLGEVNHPVYFSEFARHAAAHRLQYLSETSLGAMLDTQNLLDRVTDDPVRKEQYLDFFKLRRFRQTLLCHAGRKLIRQIEPTQMKRFFLSSQAQATPSEDGSGAVTYQDPEGGSAKTADPLAQSMFAYLTERFPRPVPFAELASAVGQDSALCPIVLACFSAGVVHLHSYEFPYAPVPGERPVASRVARVLAERETLLPNLCHHSVAIEDALSLALLPLMDGTRDRSQLIKDLAAKPNAAASGA